MNQAPISDATLRFISGLPKVELHLHLEGAMPATTLLALVAKHKISDLPQSLEELKKSLEFRDFPHFIEVYDQVVRALQNEDDFSMLVLAVGQALSKQNVRYAEVIFTPYAHLRRGIPEAVFLSGLERGRAQAQEQYGVTLRWVADFPGHEGIQAGETALSTVRNAGLPSIIGFGVGGVEVDRRPFADLFRRARAAGLHSLPHAGESNGPEQIWTSIRELEAERIGHGIRCVDDEALVDYLAASQLPLDVSPTSNLCTRVTNRIEEHPMPAMVERGLMVTLNSDDPALFSTDLHAEYGVAHKLGFSHQALAQLAKNGVAASFLPEERKAELLAEIEDFVTRARY